MIFVFSQNLFWSNMLKIPLILDFVNYIGVACANTSHSCRGHFECINMEPEWIHFAL